MNHDPITWAQFFYFTLACVPSGLLLNSKSTEAQFTGLALTVSVWAYVLFGMG